MSGESFRFIHAGDFHLDRPLGDFDDYPATIAEALAIAPRNAAAAVFEAAAAENIDFLILTGDLLSPAEAGPHGMSLLIDGFERLAAANTSVFWAAGVTDDPAHWPQSIPLPNNVHLFDKQSVQNIPVQRAGRTICRVVGRSTDRRTALSIAGYADHAGADEYTIGVGYGTATESLLREAEMDYWSLGGKTQRHRFEELGRASGGYCGTPQSRGFDQSGPHGFTVVDVDADQTCRVHTIDCDAVRYRTVDIDAADIASVGNLKNLLGSELARVAADGGGRHQMVRFELRCEDGASLTSIGDLETLLGSLRRDHGGGNPATWVAGIRMTGPADYPTSWRDEDTILGDFLREAKDTKADPSRFPTLAAFTEEQSLPTSVANQLAEVSSSRQNEILDQATMLGVHLLRGGPLPTV